MSQAAAQVKSRSQVHCCTTALRPTPSTSHPERSSGCAKLILIQTFSSVLVLFPTTDHRGVFILHYGTFELCNKKEHAFLAASALNALSSFRGHPSLRDERRLKPSLENRSQNCQLLSWSQTLTRLINIRLIWTVALLYPVDM